MIILLGPDGSGKTTLQQQLLEKGMTGFHLTKDSEYTDYMELLSGPPTRPIPLGQVPFVPSEVLQKGAHTVMDRWFYCEFPYSKVLRGEDNIRWSLKQFHNLHLATMAHNPVVVLMTRKTQPYPDSDVPEHYFQPILDSYRYWLDALDVIYFEWDYLRPPMSVDKLIAQSVSQQDHIIWWRNLAKRGIGGYGNTINPTVLVIAEILGGSNVYHYPFEAGPSGYYLSDLFDEASVPLSSFYITNWKKTNDPQENAILLGKELRATAPQKVLILGAVARNEAAKVFGLNGIAPDRIITLRHPGWVVNHAESAKDLLYRKMGYSKEWAEAWRKALDQGYLSDSSRASRDDSMEDMVLVD